MHAACSVAHSRNAMKNLRAERALTQSLRLYYFALFARRSALGLRCKLRAAATDN